MILQSMSRAAAAGMPVSCGLTAEGDIFVLNVHSEQGFKNSKSAALICEDDGEEFVGGAWGFGNASGRIDCGVV